MKKQYHLEAYFYNVFLGEFYELGETRKEAIESLHKFICDNINFKAIKERNLNAEDRDNKNI